MANEADTCQKLVLPKLVESGWDNEPHRINEQVTFTDGRIMLAGNKVRRRPQKRADYLLVIPVTTPVEAIVSDEASVDAQPVEYADPKGLVQQIPAGYNWTLDCSVYLKPGDDLDYVFGLIEQSYKDVL